MLDLLLHPRDPVSTWTHALGLVLALAVTPVLGRLGRGQPVKRLSLLGFGLGLIVCYGASVVAHGVRGPDGGPVPACDRFDLVGIYLLIAGSYTPLAAVVLRGRWRLGALLWAWSIALVASAWILSGNTPPKPVSTGLYLAMGWGCVVLIVEVAQVVGARSLIWLVAGGVLYTVGAVLDLLHWPNPVPGHVRAHEVFHVFVLGGSACHTRFMIRVIAPYSGPPGREAGAPLRGPHPHPRPTMAVGTDCAQAGRAC